MNKSSSFEAVNTSGLTDPKKFSLNEIINYFNSEIQEKIIMSKNLSKYIAAFNYFDKILIVLSAASGKVSIISFSIVIEVPANNK